MHYLKNRDLSQLRGFVRDLTTVGAGGLMCSDGQQQTMASCFLKWWEGFDLSGGPQLQGVGRGIQWGE